MSRAFSPGSAWKRALSSVGLQPFQRGPDVTGMGEALQAAAASGSLAAAVWTGALPVR